MKPHSHFWWFVLLAVLCLVLATALDGVTAGRTQTPVPANAQAAAPVAVSAESAGSSGGAAVDCDPKTVLAVKVLLHVLATAVALRIGMKIFYESVLLPGFLAIVALDALTVVGMAVAARWFDGFTAMLGPQLVVTALVMVVTLHHFGFTKARFTVIPAVLVTKAFGFFGEVALRMIFLDVLLRWAAAHGL